MSEETKSLTERYVVPPFSIFDRKQKYYLDQRRNWLKTGIKSSEGRENNLISPGFSTLIKSQENTSIFCPLLTEVNIKWFSKENDKVIDAFAGGSVRGIVTAMSKREYHGCDVRKEQITANIQNVNEVDKNLATSINYFHSCSYKHLQTIDDETYDYGFTCPPYGNLEKYSEQEDDISNKSYEMFLQTYRLIINEHYRTLKNDRFSTIVVSDFRNSSGLYVGFVKDTIDLFQKAGFGFYNDAILADPIGSAAFRAGNYIKNRKVAKIHQNVLTFVKGDWKKAASRLGNIDDAYFLSNSTDQNKKHLLKY